MRSDKLLEELDIYSHDFKEKLAELIDQRIVECIDGTGDDDRAADAVGEIVQNKLDDLEVHADSIGGLEDYVGAVVDSKLEEFSVSADNVEGLSDAVETCLKEEITLEVTVS